MASLRTEITEIITGLGMLPIGNIQEALQSRPTAMVGVSDHHYDRLSEAIENPANRRLFENAWANGAAFAQAREGLRGRTPLRVEWKGPHQLPGYEQIPVDLRVDYVYLVSCKYGSKVLHNVSPAHLFDRLLAVRRGKQTDWYNEVAPGAYQRFYTLCRDYLGDADLPERVTDLNRDQRNRLKKHSNATGQHPLTIRTKSSPLRCQTPPPNDGPTRWETAPKRKKNSYGDCCASNPHRTSFSEHPVTPPCATAWTPPGTSANATSSDPLTSNPRKRDNQESDGKPH